MSHCALLYLHVLFGSNIAIYKILLLGVLMCFSICSMFAFCVMVASVSIKKDVSSKNVIIKLLCVTFINFRKEQKN